MEAKREAAGVALWFRGGGGGGETGEGGGGVRPTEAVTRWPDVERWWIHCLEASGIRGGVGGGATAISWAALLGGGMKSLERFRDITFIPPPGEWPGSPEIFARSAVAMLDLSEGHVWLGVPRSPPGASLGDVLKITSLSLTQFSPVSLCRLRAAFRAPLLPSIPLSANRRVVCPGELIVNEFPGEESVHVHRVVLCTK